MNKILLVFLLFIIITTILLFFALRSKKPKKRYNGICAFDVDGTCLNGMNNTCYYNGKKYDKSNGGCTAAAVQACIDKGYIDAVNTASNRKRKDYYKTIGMVDSKGKCVVKEQNWWNNQKYYSLSDYQGPNHGGCGKAYIMKLLCEINGITDRKKAILWDDYYKNIIGAQSAGFGVIPMTNVLENKNELGKGIQQRQIDDFVNGVHEMEITDYSDYVKCYF